MGHTVIEGALRGEGLKVAIAVARFNSFITDRLLEGALGGLRKHGVAAEDITVVHVAGSWELPLAARALTDTSKFAAIVCLGAVIRGETAHFDYVAGEAAKGLANLQNASGVPVVFGVLTTNTTDQAIDRAGGKSGNKGYDAAVTAIETASVLRQIRGL
ncbi:MAG: 6,7-dimethyl-8-ribityllumazine synthase [Acidobacteria bacterium]|nr:6,7-dimethyl-8-ribityllumazine synthase [Acidobacteriota bacterium]